MYLLSSKDGRCCAPGACASWEQHHAAGWHPHSPGREAVAFSASGAFLISRSDGERMLPVCILKLF